MDHSGHNMHDHMMHMKDMDDMGDMGGMDGMDGMDMNDTCNCGMDMDMDMVSPKNKLFFKWIKVIAILQYPYAVVYFDISFHYSAAGKF